MNEYTIERYLEMVTDSFPCDFKYTEINQNIGIKRYYNEAFECDDTYEQINKVSKKRKVKK